MRRRSRVLAPARGSLVSVLKHVEGTTLIFSPRVFDTVHHHTSCPELYVLSHMVLAGSTASHPTLSQRAI